MAEFVMGGKIAADKIIFIYALVDPETGEKRYIGKTNDTGQRLRAHESEARYKKRSRKSKWIRSLNERGLRPVIECLEVVSAGGDWVEAEVRWIALGRSERWPLLNVTDGGDDIPAAAHSPEARAKGLATRKTSKRWIAAHAAASAKRRGSKLSEEHKRKISEGNKGRRMPDEHFAMLSAKFKGRTYSPEVIAKMTAHRKGSKATEETREKLRKARATQREYLAECQRKNWLDPQYRARMKAAMLGRPTSDEARQKKAEASTSGWKDPIIREKRMAALRAAMDTPEYREQRRAIAKAQWSDPAFRARMKAARNK